MKYGVYYFQLVICFFGFIVCYIFSGIVGSYAIEYNNIPSEIEKALFAFNHSSYPYIALLFLLWVIVVVVLLLRKIKMHI
ncbi:hypothetical protein [Cytobacillus purgationiresistens]|uniref:Uncharacterized protein n=1 Tax=Cytobacillus purgationiresistens TaxID=863449 RepID=A0ABU0AKE0_9BACI|nr:hypothetical protein [Cytobacillus purgationiresistens]MDQ0271735.1 hypothetical protein [Cytobacillus purgationiresistens]